MNKNSFIKEIREFYFSNYIQYSGDLSIDEDLIVIQEDIADFRKSIKYEFWD